MNRLDSMTLSWPADWEAIFGRRAPLVVEIGFGDGQHLLHLARQRPDQNFIGLEISNQSLVKVEKILDQGEAPNLRVIHTRAETALHHLIEAASVEAFHINYPDPWFKTRHSGRRLIQRDTLDALVSRLVPGGMLYLSTDIAAYAEMSHELLSRTPGLSNLLDDPWVHNLPGRFVTKYEAKGLRAGRPGHYFVYRRNDHPAPDVPLIKDREMPHLIFESPLSLDAMLRQFERIHQHEDGTTINVLQAYLAANGRCVLYEVQVIEPTIEQHTMLALIERERPGEFLLKLGSIGRPRPTDGMHRAVGLLGDWLAALHPDARMLQKLIRG